MGRFKFSPSAEIDLAEIWLFSYEHWSEEQANLYVRKIQKTCQMVADYPMLGRNFMSVPKKYLGFRESSHMIFFRIISVDEIKIVRILHCKMDFESQFGDLVN